MATSLRLKTTTREGYGPQVIAGIGDRWAAVGQWRIHLWQGEVLSQSVELPTPIGGRASFSADGRRLFIGVQLFDLDQESLVSLPPLDQALVAGFDPGTGPPAQQMEVNGAAWSPDGQQLAVYTQFRPLKIKGHVPSYSGPRQRLLLLDGRSRDLDAILWQGSSPVEYTTIALSESQVAAGGQTIQVWDRQNGQAVAEGSAHQAVLRDLRFSRDQARAISAGYDGRVVVWGTSRWQPLANWLAHEGGAHAAAFHPTQPLVASGGEDGQVKLWSLDDEPALLSAAEMEGSVKSLAFLSGGRDLVAADDEGWLGVWECRGVGV